MSGRGPVQCCPLYVLRVGPSVVSYHINTVAGALSVRKRRSLTSEGSSRLFRMM